MNSSDNGSRKVQIGPGPTFKLPNPPTVSATPHNCVKYII